MSDTRTIESCASSVRSQERPLVDTEREKNDYIYERTTDRERKRKNEWPSAWALWSWIKKLVPTEAGWISSPYLVERRYFPLPNFRTSCAEYPCNYNPRVSFSSPTDFSRIRPQIIQTFGAISFYLVVQIFKPSLKRRMQEEIETAGGNERRCEREREGEEGNGGTDSWLHHISLAVVECALTVRVASVVVQHRWGDGEATWPPTGAMLETRTGGDARVYTNAESPCGPRGQSRSILSRLLAEPREHEVMHARLRLRRPPTITTTTITIIIVDDRRWWREGRRPATFWGSPSSVHDVTTRGQVRERGREERESGDLPYLLDCNF